MIKKRIIKKDFSLAGWISIIHAALTIPLGLLSFYLGVQDGNDIGTRVFQTVLATISTGLIVYMLLSFKELLNIKFNFYKINNLVDFSVLGNLIALLLTILSLFLGDFGKILIMIAIIPLGVIQIVLFIKLLELKDDLYGLLKPFAYTSIITGVLTISLIFILFSFISIIVSNVMLGMIFFKASK